MSDDNHMDQDLLERFRRARARDSARPSEATRTAILENARRLATQNAKASSFDTRRPAANWPRWRIAAGTVGVAMLGAVLMFPRYSTRTEKVTAPSSGNLASTSMPASPTVPAQAEPQPEVPTVAPSRPGAAWRKAQDSAPPPTGSADARAKNQGYSEPALEEMPVAGKLRKDGFARTDAAPSAVNSVPAAPPAAANSVASSRLSGGKPPAASLDMLKGSAPLAARAAPQSETLLEAVTAGDAAKVQALLAQGADTRLTDASGRSPLMLAVMAGRKDLVSALLAHGADANRADSSGATPLQRAREFGNDDIATLLISAGGR